MCVICGPVCCRDNQTSADVVGYGMVSHPMILFVSPPDDCAVHCKELIALQRDRRDAPSLELETEPPRNHRVLSTLCDGTFCAPTAQQAPVTRAGVARSQHRIFCGLEFGERPFKAASKASFGVLAKIFSSWKSTPLLAHSLKMDP